MIDKIRFAQAMDEFLIKMDLVLSAEHPAIQDAMTSICKVLRISQVGVILYEMKDGERQRGSNRQILYRSGQFDATRFQQMKEIMGGGNEIIFRVHQNLGEEAWREDELKRIRVFLRLVSTFYIRVREKEIIERITFYDLELDLHNVNYFYHLLRKRIEGQQIDEYGACFFNLKKFSHFNQRYGKTIATKIMLTYVNKLQKLTGVGGEVCRVEGDNFVVLFKKDMVDRVWKHLQGIEFYIDELEGEKLSVSANAGYYMMTDECKRAEDVMSKISAALQAARSSIWDDAIFYDEIFRQKRERKLYLENIFSDAISKEEFVVYYQPQVSIDGYRMIGAEALCRWFHDGKLVMPGDFIPVLEQSGRICELDFYILESVCRDIRKWMNEGRDIVRISVNLSRMNLSASNILEHIIFILDHYQVPHKYIEIELTETTTDVDLGNLKKLVSGLKHAGIYTAIDDFGVGYSSLNLIRQAPWDVLKLDKSLIPLNTVLERQQKTMLKYLIAMAQEIGLICVAEGVETKEQLELLKEYGCDVVQGYYFAKPLPREEFEHKMDHMNHLEPTS